jgi:hypothetical protein
VTKTENEQAKEEFKQKAGEAAEGKPQMPAGFPFMGMPGMGGMPMMPGMGMPGMGGSGDSSGMPGLPEGFDPSAGPEGMFNPEMMSNMMNNPMVKAMINDFLSDPNKIKGVLEANPILKQMAEGNPDLEELVKDPSKIKDKMTDQNIDEVMKGMQQNMEKMTGGAAGAAGATGAAATAAVTSTGSSGETTEAVPTSSATPAMDPMAMFANMMGGPSGPGGIPNMGMPPGLEQMMGGVDPEMLNKMMAGFDMGGLDDEEGKSNERFENMTEDQLKSEFEDQLATMSAMGFTDEKVNIEHLKTSDGDVDKAMEKVLNSS